MPKIIDDPIHLILDQARIVLQHEGYSKLNMRKLAKLSGVSVGTVYNYFPTKKDLITFLMIEFWDNYYQEVDRIELEETDFYAKLRKMFEKIKVFVDTFKEGWLKMIDEEEIESIDRQGEKDHIAKLILRMEKIISQETQISQTLQTKKLAQHDIAQFIILNLIMLAQFRQMKYQNFEKIIRTILTN